MSETPVISDRGACPEIISEGVGFVCRDPSDYLHARDRLEDVHSRDCRAKALRDFHYLRMVDYYVDQYRHEVAACAGAGGASARADR